MMPIQIRCVNVELPQSERLEIESSYYQALDRFSHFIREAQITLRDTNGPRGGVDKLCTIQLRLFPRGIAVVKSSGTSFAQAVNTACDKMQEVAARRLSKTKSGSLKSSRIKLEGGTLDPSQQ